MPTIADQDLTIVVQGPILATAAHGITTTTTKIVCRQLRKLFPQSELILSTWVGEDVSDLTYDQVLFNRDPGAVSFVYQDQTTLNNGNRLIVSTLAGIRAASRQYVLKVRSDLWLHNKKFLNYFARFQRFNPHYRCVTERILAFSIFTVKAERQCSHRTVPFPYHVSDWAYFGLKTDLLKLYDIPLMPEPEFSQWFATRYKPYVDSYQPRMWRMTPEQYVTSTFFSKYFPIQFDHSADTAHDNITLSAKLISNNFVILDQTQFRLLSLKYLNLQLLFKPILARTAVFYHTWLADYLRYTTPFDLPTKLYYYLIIISRKLWSSIINLIGNRFEPYVSRLLGRRLKRHWDKQ